MFLDLMSWYTFAWFVPLKGTDPTSILKRMFPIAQVSRDGVWTDQSMTSGDWQLTVPTKVSALILGAFSKLSSSSSDPGSLSNSNSSSSSSRSSPFDSSTTELIMDFFDYGPSSLTLLASPKSITLMLQYSSIMMFPGFKSLCITPYYYRYSKKLII